MQIRPLVIAALFAGAGAAHADVVTTQAVPGKALGASRADVVHTPMPAQLTLDQAVPAVPATPATSATPAVPGVSPAIPATPATPAIPAIPAAPVAVDLPSAPTEVPEPSSIALLLAGVLGAGALRRRRKTQSKT